MTAEDVQQAKAWNESGVTWKECARRLSVHPETLRRALNPEVYEKHKQVNRVWRERNVHSERQKDREWWQANPHAVAAREARRRARKLRVPGPGWSVDEQRFLLSEIYQNCCVYCNAEGVPLTLDHVVPLSRGGSNEKHNLVFCCKHCNCSKNAALLSEWRDGNHLGVYVFAQEVAEYVAHLGLDTGG